MICANSNYFGYCEPPFAPFKGLCVLFVQREGDIRNQRYQDAYENHIRWHDQLDAWWYIRNKLLRGCDVLPSGYTNLQVDSNGSSKT